MAENSAMKRPNRTLKLLGAVSIWLSITQSALSLDCGTDFRTRSKRFASVAEIAFVGTPIAARHLGEHEGLDYFLITYRVEEALRGISAAKVRIADLTWFDGGATPERIKEALKRYSEKALVFPKAYDSAELKLIRDLDFIRELGKDRPIGFVGCVGTIPASKTDIYLDLVEMLRRDRR